MSAELLFAIELFLLLLVELAYFRIADYYNIIDKPNERSSHTLPVIRGGGVIFLFSVVLWFLHSGFQWPWFVLSILVIAIISFIDDIASLKPLPRFTFQLIAVLLIFYQLWPMSWPVYLMIAAVVVVIGTINAFNFMDGINGITGIYAGVMLLSFWYVQKNVIAFTDENLLVLTGAAVGIFLYFNFRKRARCFAGDVGSITMALVLVFLLLQLIKATGNFLWPLLFLVYGTDSIITIVYRLKRKENIFDAHRTHLYQYLSNEMKIPHRTVSLGYGLVQGGLNIVFIYFFSRGNAAVPVVIALLYVSVYEFVRLRVMKKISQPLR
jgi:UDP-N-acetylmuramyl pentapeptide phosphotransferase/UDP-N-acetylglucosamine-1-phosphate transferase